MTTIWDKVFTTGTHTDGYGNTRKWTTADLDKMVATFKPSFHEPPVVIGHPSDNAPAFGWVSGIKRDGNDLLLTYRDVAPQFKNLVDQKLYKKKSIAVYPDGSLRHVGYLGAVPPAIKGLPDFQFKTDQEFSTFDFSDQIELGMWRRLKNWLIGKEGQAAADELFPEWQLESMARDAYTPEVPDQITVQETDMTKEEVQAIFAESGKALIVEMKATSEAMNKALEGMKVQFSELSKAHEDARTAALKREFREFLATPDMQKRVSEGSREAIINQMVTLSTAAPVEFGEGATKTTISALESYKADLAKLPDVVTFGETATKAAASDTLVNGLSAEALAGKAVEFQEAEAKAGRTITMTAAVNHIKGGK
ncbi:MAG: hypothetical protein ACOYL3_16110 [Desulfuromonadaceae bacterium]